MRVTRAKAAEGKGSPLASGLDTKSTRGRRPRTRPAVQSTNVVNFNNPAQSDSAADFNGPVQPYNAPTSEPPAQTVIESTPELDSTEKTNGHKELHGPAADSGKPPIPLPSYMVTPEGQLDPLYATLAKVSQADVPGFRSFASHPNLIKGEKLALHLLVEGRLTAKPVSMNVPSQELQHIIHLLVNKYGVIQKAPKLTLVTDEERPKYPVISSPPPKSPKQYYRPIKPTYDQNGKTIIPTEKDLLLWVDEEDNSDLDTELDLASYSKGNISTKKRGSIEGFKFNSPPAPTVQNADSGALVVHEDVEHRDDFHDVPALPATQVPETPKTRG